MSSPRISWDLRVPKLRDLRRAPRPERERLAAALEEMANDPFAGDVVPLSGSRDSFRRRAGPWRILYDVDRRARRIDVTQISRRTTTTYRRRG